MGEAKQPQPLVLGLDLGANSVGWAVLKLDDKGNPAAILGAGARIFPEGVDVGYGDGLSSGRDVSRNVQRRTARQRRRMLARRRMRLRTLARALQRHGLLPGGSVATGEERHALIEGLDNTIFTAQDRQQDAHTLCYRLRARALDEKLEPFAVGRALYHLAHRRGFLSNRKGEAREDEDLGAVKKGISDLERAIAARGSRTLGEFFSELNPTEVRIRARWTARQMYWAEFEEIWDAQTPHHPGLMSGEARKAVFKAMFHQRPLKSVAHLVGECELEKGRKRAPKALLESQRFRYLQKVNLLEVTIDATGEIRPLSAGERAAVVAALESEGDRTFSQIRALLGLKKQDKFNFEVRDGESKLEGNRTARRLRDVFGAAWDGFNENEKMKVVEDVRSIVKEETLERRARDHYRLSPEKARELAGVALEDGYFALSRQAIAKLMPRLQAGESYSSARKAEYGEPRPASAVDILPPLLKSGLPFMRNPAVERTLAETRKVVNAVLRKWGKPLAIRIELARDLKRSRKDRQEIWKRNQANEKSRQRAAEAILREAGIQNPSRSDIEKWLLREECGGICPYTGEPISVRALYVGAFDVEHIIPFSRSLDDSFNNKTLCKAEENRNTKGNRTPYEAYGGDPERYEAILARVDRFTGASAEEKKRRFQKQDWEGLDDFSSRQLNDTRYASRAAARYLGLLYAADAGGVDVSGKRLIQVGRGQVTAFVRNELNLNRILGDGGRKSRDDHRHHAVDAVAIALTDAGLVKKLSAAASAAGAAGRRRFAPLAPPWDDFFGDVKAVVDGIIVSHRPSHKVNGPLHEETFYARPRKVDGKVVTYTRKPLVGLSDGQVEDIVDARVRGAVQSALKDGKPGKVFASAESHPRVGNVPVHRVRIRVSEKVIPLGGGRRHVASGSIHHVEVFEDASGDWQWFGVSRLEALQRVAEGVAVVQKERVGMPKFLFSLSNGDLFRLEGERAGAFIVRTFDIAKQRVAFVRHADARQKKEIQKVKEWYTLSLKKLREMNFSRVATSALGEAAQ